MNVSEAIALQAFSIARLHLGAGLTDDLRQAVQEVADAIARNQPDAVDRVRSLVERHECFRKPYEAAYFKLQAQYHKQEQFKGLRQASTPPRWKQVVTQILTADDPRLTAQELLKTAKAREDSSTAIGQPYLSSLRTELEALNTQEVTALKALEKRPLTTEDLVYVVNQGSPEQVRTLVRSLWQRGYIDRVTGGLLSKLFPRLRRHADQEIDSDTPLTLTSKGHFHLHPLIVHGPPDTTPQ